MNRLPPTLSEDNTTNPDTGLLKAELFSAGILLATEIDGSIRSKEIASTIEEKTESGEFTVLADRLVKHMSQTDDYSLARDNPDAARILAATAQNRELMDIVIYKTDYNSEAASTPGVSNEQQPVVA